MITIPWITICQMAGTLIRAMPLSNTPMKTDPSAPTRTLPAPPLSETPPTTAAAIVSSSSPEPRYGTARPTCETIMTPASAAHAPEMAYVVIRTRRTFNPDNSAAAGLPPIAWIARPSTVRRSTTYATANSSKKINTETGRSWTCPRPMKKKLEPSGTSTLY